MKHVADDVAPLATIAFPRFNHPDGKALIPMTFGNRSRRQMRLTIFAISAMLTGGMAAMAPAQERKDIIPPKTPLILKEQGSFMVGGEVASVNVV